MFHRKVEKLPGNKCDICNKMCFNTIIDAPIINGPWAHMCKQCFEECGHEPATLFELTVRQEKEYTQEDIEKHANALTDEDLQAMMFDTLCETIDGCVVEPDGKCEHGYPSPLRVLGII